MEVYKGTEFSRWASKYNISDEMLVEAIDEMRQGLYEANLGGNVYKKRMALGGKGKSSGARTIVAFNLNDKSFFIYGFAKNKRDNISEEELKALKKLAKIYLNFTDSEIKQAIRKGNIIRVEQKNE